jgi:hypothetical protein
MGFKPAVSPGKRQVSPGLLVFLPDCCSPLNNGDNTKVARMA